MMSPDDNITFITGFVIPKKNPRRRKGMGCVLWYWFLVRGHLLTTRVTLRSHCGHLGLYFLYKMVLLKINISPCFLMKVKK